MRASARCPVFGDREERCKGGGVVGVGRRLGDAVVAGEAGGADAVDLGMEIVADGGDQRGQRRRAGSAARQGPRGGRGLRARRPVIAQSISRILVVQRSAVKSRRRSKFAGSRHITSRSVPMCSKTSRMSARRWRVRLASEVSIPPRSGRGDASSSKMYSTAGRFEWKLSDVHEAAGHVPLLAGHDHQFPVAPERRALLPEAGGEALAGAALRGEEGVEAAAFVRDAEVDARGGVERAEAGAQLPRLGRDLAGEGRLLREEEVVVVVVEGHRHPVVGEHEEGGRPGDDLVLGDEVGDEGLEEGLVRDPCGAEEAGDVGAALEEGEDRLGRAAAEAPPLAADHDAQARGRAGGRGRGASGGRGRRRRGACADRSLKKWR